MHYGKILTVIQRLFLSVAILLVGYLLSCPLVFKASRGMSAEETKPLPAGGYYAAWDVLMDESPMRGVMIKWTEVCGVSDEFYGLSVQRRLRRYLEQHPGASVEECVEFLAD